ncbi:DUF6343 family protein [Herbidospora sp. RD11066]
MRNVRDKFWDTVSPTSERPESPLTLRIALAAFGLIVCAALAVVAFLAGVLALGIILAVLALIAVVDLVAVIRRRHKRGNRHSLFS